MMVASAGATAVRVDPASQTIAAGDPFHVNITVEDVVNMKGNAATLNFDPSVMQVTNITEGDFLKTGGRTVGVGNWDNTTGTAVFGYTLGFYDPWTTVDGSGTLATIQFSTYPDAPADTYDLILTDVELRNATNDLIPRDVVNGNVPIEGAPVPVPVLSGIGMIALIAALAVVLAISVSSATRRRKK
jgi:hypothetical protein